MPISKIPQQPTWFSTKKTAAAPHKQPEKKAAAAAQPKGKVLASVQLKKEPSQVKKAPVVQQPAKKREELPKKAYDEFEAFPSKKASIEYAKLLEETERTRRIYELEFQRKQQEMQQKTNRAYSRLLEEEERERRLADLTEKKVDPSLLQEIRSIGQFFSKTGGSITGLKNYIAGLKNLKEEREDNKAWTIIAEEEERQRRIAIDSYLKERALEQRADNIAWTVIAEEQERERRIAEEEYLKEVEHDRSATNRAYSIVAEEQERARRIAEEGWLNELEYEYRADDGAWVTIATEQERARILSFGQFAGIPQDQIEFHKQVFEEVASQCLSKFGLEQPRPLQKAISRPQLGGLKKMWMKKDERPSTFPKQVAQKPTPVAQSGQATKKAQVPKPAPASVQKTKVSPTTTAAPQVKAQPVPKEQPTGTDRKTMVDTMTEKLFSQLQTKMGLTR